MPRTKGSRNTRTIEFRMAFDRVYREMLKEHDEDVCPVHTLAELSRTKYEPSIRVQAAARLASHLYPTLKAIEVAADGSPLETAADAAGQLELVWSSDDEAA